MNTALCLACADLSACGKPWPGADGIVLSAHNRECSMLIRLGNSRSHPSDADFTHRFAPLRQCFDAARLTTLVKSP